MSFVLFVVSDGVISLCYVIPVQKGWGDVCGSVCVSVSPKHIKVPRYY